LKKSFTGRITFFIVSNDNAQGTTKTTSVKLPLELDDRLEKALIEWDGDKSKFIRKAIEDLLLFLDEMKDLKLLRIRRRAQEELDRKEREAAEESPHPHVKFPYVKKASSAKAAPPKGTRAADSSHQSSHPKGK
jgi:predicted DNA-binding protein